MTHDETAELVFATIVEAQRQGVADPLRLAHAIAVAVRLAEDDDRGFFTYDEHGRRVTK